MEAKPESVKRDRHLEKIMQRMARNEITLTKKEEEKSPMRLFYRRRVARDFKMLERKLNVKV